MTQLEAPRAFHIMAKPTGSACNLNCDYCFFLKKESLYPGSDFRMSDEVHEAYIRQLLEAHQVPSITIAWQGGEPTLMGLDFFRRSVELQKKYQKPGSQIENTFQTNGILLNDEWVRRDVGHTFVLNFDGALAGWLSMAGTVCIFGPTCGLGMALEHNGDLYSCDHFVEPNYYLGNVLKTPMIELVTSEKQRKFGQDKRDTLPKYCRECDVLSICHGECPKNRFTQTPDGEAGLNYLCEGYRAFSKHADKPMRIMADLIRRGRLAEEVMAISAREKGDLKEKIARAGRNDLCPCGSGLKFKKCHGK